MSRKVSRNGSRTAWVLKCDVRKFFASIGHDILMGALSQRIADERVICLIEEVVGSFNSGELGRGLPLGNLTSQLFANVYLDAFDKYAKHVLRARYYLRYADDFLLMSADRRELEEWQNRVQQYLENNLRLSLHPAKNEIRTLASGIDFLGWIHFANHRVLRKSTRRRMVRTVAADEGKETIASYRALLKHGNAEKLTGYLDRAETI